MRVFILSMAFFIVPTSAFLLFKLSERVKRLRLTQQLLEEQTRRQALYTQDLEDGHIDRYTQLNDDDRRPNRK